MISEWLAILHPYAEGNDGLDRKVDWMGGVGRRGSGGEREMKEKRRLRECSASERHLISLL